MTRALLVVAHPDDETLFFGGLLLETPSYEWTVICVTDGNGDGRGKERATEFSTACSKLGAKHFEMWHYPDKADERLNVTELELRLRERVKGFEKVFTHGVIGEYGHIHHQDVSYAVHMATSDTEVLSCAYNIYPDFKVELSEKSFQRKTDILWNVYHKETSRLLNLLPATFTEGFVKLDLSEVKDIYAHFTKGTKLTQLKKYKWLEHYLDKGHLRLSVDSFLQSYFVQSSSAHKPS